MLASLNRVWAISTKEWRLNLRFPLEFFIGNFVSPLKSSILMCLLYSGFFRNSAIALGGVTGGNYISYVLLGTVLHGQFTSSIGVFRGKMVTEKYWQTATATLLTPVSIFEVIMGFMIGSGGVTILVNALILTGITFVYPIPLPVYFLSILVLFLLALLGFGLGLIGATIGLCWEGKSFVFDYAIQAITFLSCFYYPIELLPKAARVLVRIMPTYQLSNSLHQLYAASSTTDLPLTLGYMITVCVLVMAFSGYLFETSIRKFGPVGY